MEPFNFTLYTKRTYMCDTYGLITANSTCPFGTSWSPLYVCPAVDHVSSNGGHCAQEGYGRMPQTAALDPALLMYIRYVCTHAYVLSECTDRSMYSSLTRRPEVWCALRARSTVSWSALVDRVHGAVVYPCTYARMCVSMCVCVCRT